ncbi:hypothetical protein [Arcticibacterium luteifluviistationis]|uniref:O-antigen ligase domain-containing protein n=1 Tax=Arcticibacterium luteifluviistationis TaxID=1784714 RepID=A0A2Z4GBK8_9BACT|nr:hypothetical protein [Arcticibacterium luteifluviistationis]AWV98606.1 hypothetical protein DJ013_10670 [Arcticibacterium luteifluviistationis]
MRLLNFILKHRDAFAISMVFCSGPLNYAIRDGIGLAPNSTAFSTLFMLGSIFAVLPFRNFKSLYINDTPLVTLGVSFLVMVILYMIIYPAYRYMSLTLFIYDYFVIGIVLYFYFYLMTVRESYLRMNFLKICIAISLLGSIGLIFFVMRNPNYVYGQRFAIAYGESEMEAMGNPHIFGRGAFFGIVSAFIYLKYETRQFWKYVAYFSLVIFFAVLILAQAMSSIISGFLFVCCYFWFNNDIRSIWKKFKFIFTKWYVWIVVIFMAMKGIDFIRQNEAILDLGYRIVQRRIENLVNTFIPEDVDDKWYSKGSMQVDASASGRVEILNTISENLADNFNDGKYLNLIFGNGYFAFYVDVPIVEVFNSYGLVGFLLFGVFFYLMLKYCYLELKKPSSIISEFAAYGFIYFFVFTFTNGLIIDYNRWTFFALVCRFMPAIKNTVIKSKTA